MLENMAKKIGVMANKRDIRGDIRVDPKVEMNDYSGPFKPDLRYTDFSREHLARMYAMGTDYNAEQIRAPLEHILEKYGIEAWIEANRDTWGKRFAPRVYQLLSEEMNIKGKDIESLMKMLQLDCSWSPMWFDLTFEMPSKDRGIITCYKCPGVDLFEKLGTQNLLRELCNAVCEVSRAEFMKNFSPDIVVKTLVKPPPKSKDDPCCKWEFTYKSK